MYRHSPARIHRSKGIKVKHVLQICVLLAVCFWLIYQVKHSHDKKKEYDESDENALHQRAGDGEHVKLGRKDIRSRVDGTNSKNEDNDEQQEEEEEATEEKVEVNKAEDEPEYKVEQKEDEDGDEDSNVHEQEKSVAEVDREGESVDEEEREDIAENGTQETDSEHGNDQVDKEISSEDTDMDHDGDNRSINEAREEHYKADDASSAVTHGIQTGASGIENEHTENSNEKIENSLEAGNEENDIETDEGEGKKYLQVEGDQMTGDNQQLNATSTETKVAIVNNTGNGSSTNNTVTEGFDNHLASNKSNEATIENLDLPTQNVTNEPKLDQVQGSLSEGTSAEQSNMQTLDLKGDNTSVVNVNSNHSDSNSTGFKETKGAESNLEEFPNSSNNITESSQSENIVRSEVSVEAGNNTESASEKNDEIKEGKSDTVGVTDETLDSTITENPEDIQNDAIDKSDTFDSLEEKNVRVDLDTLPEIQTEGTNSEDVAAE